MKDGLLLVDKPGDCTSHDVVQRARRLLRQKKIGHCGTLDPTATGLLLLTLGKATRLTRFLINAPKVYTGLIRFGSTTDTYDAAGETVERSSTDQLRDGGIAEAMAKFVGEYNHLIPAYSAKKSGGVKRYELARRGEEVEEERKIVRVFAFEPLTSLRDDAVEFRLACGSGTYARSLAHELGQLLGTGAHLAQLRRTEVGPFSVDKSTTLDDLARMAEDTQESDSSREGDSERNGWHGWVPFDDITLPFSAVSLDAQQEWRIQHGQTVLIQGIAVAAGDWVRLDNRRGGLLSVGTVSEVVGAKGIAVVQPRIVFN